MRSFTWHAKVGKSSHTRYGRSNYDILCGADYWACDSTTIKAEVTCRRCMATKKWKGHVGRTLNESDFEESATDLQRRSENNGN